MIYDASSFGGPTADTIDASWDGTGLLLRAPDGYKIVVAPSPPYGDQGCTPNDDVPTSVTCAATGQPPRLFHIATQGINPSPFLPHRSPPIFAGIVSPSTSDAQAVNHPVSFAANGPPDLAYIWNFGDATIAVEQAVQHSYAAAGSHGSADRGGRESRANHPDPTRRRRANRRHSHLSGRLEPDRRARRHRAR